ncbi:transcriptional regulator [Litchfieldella qijiaojingensis]|uniref:Transcriptional regulator n=1 Tax=Litchfieldella qijiaojingensis TaxID=980347 RepID=A0ABQ2ZC85_9GAMM|nr:helix-turn-helix transcriptional regulator [Halomonas qijiaojingensis]GGY10393.1 transcriptional regulator [Halomonas qijiaojingensis]
MSSDLGKKVRAIREAEGMGRQAFCNVTGITKQTLINIEQGRNAPSGKLLAQVTKAFPQYTMWLMNDQVIEEVGQISPYAVVAQVAEAKGDGYRLSGKKAEER